MAQFRQIKRRIKVLLDRGPASLAEAERIREVGALSEVVKLPHGNGYEHFTYSGESRDLNGSRLPVFRWSYRTKLAE